MGIRTTYNCNICGKDDFSREMIGILYTGDSAITFTNKSDTNIHICVRCIECLKEILG